MLLEPNATLHIGNIKSEWLRSSSGGNEALMLMYESAQFARICVNEKIHPQTAPA